MEEGFFRDPTKWSVVLVHGTWAGSSVRSKSPPWFDKGSKFRARLDQAIAQISNVDARIHLFRWSGKNSIHERNKAGAELAALLSDDARSSDCRIIIAHSHGGNVALRAFEHLPDHKGIFLVTLATPFVEVYPPAGEGQTLQSLMLLYALISSCLLVTNGQFLPNSLFIPAVASVFLLLGWGLLTTLRTQALQRLCQASSHQSYEDANVDHLVVRGVDDEAALALAAGAIANRIFMLVAGKIPFRTTLAAYLFGVAVVIGGRLDFGILQPLAKTIETRLGIFSIGLWPWFIFFSHFALLIAGSVCKSVYGRELFLSSPDAQVNSGSCPDNRGKTWVMTVRPPIAALRHSLYDAPTIPHIAIWWAAKLINKTHIELPLGLHPRAGWPL